MRTVTIKNCLKQLLKNLGSSVTILLLVTLLLSCCTTNKDYISCRQSIKTFGDSVECVIILDEQLKNM